MQLEHWQMKDFAPGEGAADKGDGWISVTAPGDTYLALHKAGRIPHPFADQNETVCAWVEHREWWWRTTFDAAKAGEGERLRLEFEGLDTFAAIWLNGERIGTTDNMFRAFAFDVTKLVRDEKNSIAICFTPPSAVTANMPVKAFPGASVSIAESKRNMIRKAQFGWGWDWGPSFPTVGIWKPVRLVRERAAALRDVSLTTISADGRVRVGLEIDAFAVRDSLTAEISIADPDGKIVVRHKLDPARERSVELEIANPKLWWTRELGAQPLYALSVTLLHGGETVDRRTLDVGIRTIALALLPRHPLRWRRLPHHLPPP